MSSSAARTFISSGSTFEEQIAYSRAIVTGDLVFVSGCTGYDYKTHTISSDVAEQAEQCFVTISEALKEAGASMDEVVRVNYTLPNRDDFPLIWPVTRKWFADARPAGTMISAQLMREEMKVEIEVTAVKGSAAAAKKEGEAKAAAAVA